MSDNIDYFLVHCDDRSKWTGASKPIKPLHRIDGIGCIYCCLESKIEKLQAELLSCIEKNKGLCEMLLKSEIDVVNENIKLQAELAEKESIIEQMVDMSVVIKLNEEIAEKNKEIERLQGTKPFELLAMACQEIIELKEKLNK